MNNADKDANKYACKNATKISNTEINKAIGTDKKPQAADLLMNIIDISARIIIWPAVKFANKRIIKAKGFVKIPTNSIGIIIGNKTHGTPGVAKICLQ